MNHFPTDKEYVCEWYERHPGGQNPYPINSDQYSVRGEHVRSKSEKILADMFERMGIPYVYEPMVMLENGKILYPDFLILNVRYRKTCIFEHFGMMDNSEYSQNVCQKISAYAMNEIFPGDKLLFSMETKTKQLNEACVEKMLSKWLESE